MPAPAEVADADLGVAAAALNRAQEAAIRTLPEQYWWAYPRFRQGPEGKTGWYERRPRTPLPVRTPTSQA